MVNKDVIIAKVAQIQNCLKRIESSTNHLTDLQDFYSQILKHLN